MKKVFFAIILLLAAFSSGAQTIDAAQIDRWLLSETLSASQAAFMLGSARGYAFDTAADAFSFAVDKKWISPKLTEDSPVAFDDFAFIATGFFLIRESFMIRLFPVKRFAYRDLVYAQIIQGRFDPKSYITGQQALTILARLLEREEQSDQEGLLQDSSISWKLAR